MSMETLTIFQLAGIFCAYLFVSVGLPAFVFGKKMRGHRTPERLIFYFMVGNFYIMNLVFALQLLKISYPVTLILGTLLPAAVARIAIYRVPVLKIAVDLIRSFRKLVGGQMGVRTAAYKLAGAAGRQILRFAKWVGYFFFRRFFDCALTAAMLAALWWLYGNNLLEQFGYKASDVLVHNYWINAMSQNHIFVAGVYPHGFHAVIYYLHAAFGIETFVLLRVFAFVQNVMLHLMILCCLRMCCKTKYAAYIGTFIYLVGAYFRPNTYARFYATLPQEFGIIFILPAVYFLFAYFEVRKQELLSGGESAPGGKKERKKRRKRGKNAAEEIREEPAEEDTHELSLLEISLEEVDLDEVSAEGAGKKNKKRRGIPLLGKLRNKDQEIPKGRRKQKQYPVSWLYLAGFAMSFSMTLAVHFYGTMVAGIYCMGIAVGYFSLLFKKPYFKNVMAAGLISVGVAVLPMVLAFIGGTPLQGSLGWGMNIIKGTSAQSNASSDEKKDDQSAGQEETKGDNGNSGNSGNSGNAQQNVSGSSTTVPSEGENGTLNQEVEEEEEIPLSLSEKLQRIPAGIAGFARTAVTDIHRSLKNAVFSFEDESDVYWIMLSFCVLIGMGLLYLLFRQKCYGGMLVSTGVYMIFMCILMASRTFHLPALMDNNRGSIYFTYSLPAVLAFLVDGVLYLPFFPLKKLPAKIGRVIMNLLSLACVVYVVYYMVETDRIKAPRQTKGQIPNEAVVCLTNIIHNEKDFTWTIVSANDELRMSEEYGYHYETITFLREMEGASPNAMIRIPTSVVYFFIEKIPVDYYVTYENSGQAISREGALRDLPWTSGIGIYQGERRWIVMSRMYYWAENFRSLYPDEMEVYMETENFICYRIEQNPYHLYNFAINYGFNVYDNNED